MNCKTAQHWTQLELDGELPAHRAAALAGHLDCCPACSRVRRQMRALRSAMRELADVTGGAPPASKSTGRKLSPPPRRFAWLGGLAAAAVLAIGVGIWLTRTPTTTAPQPSVIVERPSPAEPSGVAVKPPAVTEPFPEPLPTLRPVVRVEFSSPEHVIAVPYETQNPNVTIIWLYPAVRGEQAAGTPEKEPPAAKGASS